MLLYVQVINMFDFPFKKTKTLIWRNYIFVYLRYWLTGRDKERKGKENRSWNVTWIVLIHKQSVNQCGSLELRYSLRFSKDQRRSDGNPEPSLSEGGEASLIFCISLGQLKWEVWIWLQSWLKQKGIQILFTRK